jgi:hypothetical protein
MRKRGCFHGAPTCHIHMEKQDKALQNMAHPCMLLQYGGRATLAQAFTVVEQLDKGLCVEEVGRLSSVMATTSSFPKAIVAGPSKAQGTLKSSRQVAMVAEVEEAVNPCMRCWNCGLLGHGKRNCPSEKFSDGKSGSQSSSGGSKVNVTNKGECKKHLYYLLHTKKM